ncbi:MAG: alpha/beta hydrolase [Pseudonocardiales bacterium]
MARLSRATQAVGRVGGQVRTEAARALGGDMWLGAAAQAAHRSHHHQGSAAEGVATVLYRAATALDRLDAAAVEGQRQREAAMAAAAHRDRLLYQPSLLPLGNRTVDLILATQLTRIAHAEQVADTAAAAALRAAAAHLRGLRLHPGASAVAAAADPATVVTLARLGVLVPVGLSPGEVIGEVRRLLRLGNPVALQAFVVSLPPAARAGLVTGVPDLVGPADGVPPEMRYAANRLVLMRGLTLARRRGDAAQVRRIAGWLRGGRQFLLVDLAGGRLAEVFGDLATATHVAVVVPGILNDVTNFDALAVDAANLQGQAAGLGNDGVAAVAWLGYRTPGLIDAPFDDRAVAAGHRLADLVAGLVLRAGVTTTVIAHSYGSMLAGRSLRAGLRVDAVVVLGSPGMIAGTVAGLDAAPGTRLFAGRAPGDYVSLSENFGRDPSDPRFGATRIATHSAGQAGPAGHTNYFTGQSECTRNLARIITGQYGDVSVIAPSGMERAAGALDSLTSATRISVAVVLADAAGLAHLLPARLHTPAEDAVEAGRRAEHLTERLTDPDLAADAADTR